MVVAAGAVVGLDGLDVGASSNDSGPTWTLNVAPRKRTTRMKTKRVTLRGLRILKRGELIFLQVYTIRWYKCFFEKAGS